MGKLLDVVGRRFGSLTAVTNPAVVDDRKYRCWVRCDCGVEKHVSYYTLLRPNALVSCGCRSFETAGFRRGPTHHLWKGGRKKSNGYAFILIREHYPAIQEWYPTHDYIQEHIAVMASHLGRRLYAGENVHHKNGVRNDNRLENLELWVSSQPSGQRPEDLVAWAETILLRYKP